MKKVVLFLLVTTMGYSQTISKQVLGAAGKTLTNSNIKISWTVGEPVVGLMTAGGRNQLANGYHQAFNIQVLSLQDNSIEAQILVFPNPTSQFLYVSHPELNAFGIQIVDLNGKQVYSGTISKEQPLDVSNYFQGMYFVTIENKVTNQKNTYKIIKK